MRYPLVSEDPRAEALAWLGRALTFEALLAGLRRPATEVDGAPERQAAA